MTADWRTKPRVINREMFDFAFEIMSLSLVALKCRLKEMSF
jgi:hypothetical protein